MAQFEHDEDLFGLELGIDIETVKNQIDSSIALFEYKAVRLPGKPHAPQRHRTDHKSPFTW